jgi:trimeric autotransporter adhesin
LADNLKIAIRLVADGSDFRAEIDQATRGLDRLGASAGVVDAAMAGHGRTLARTGGEMDALSTRSRAVQEAQSGAARAMDQLARAAVALGAGLTVGTLIEYADGWKSVESRLKLVTNGAAELRAAQEQLFDVAQRTRQSFDATAETFARFARSTQGMGASNGDILRVVETINQAVAISGGPAASAEAALFQLGQAMASGALRGDELNSVLEQTPRLAEAIATGMGRSTGELRSMAEQGKLTSDAVLRSLLNQGAAVNREFGQITPTVASSMTMLRNAVQKYVGETDQAWGATRALAGGVASLANNLDAVAGMAGKAALGVAAIGAARLIPTGVQALTTAIDDQRVALYAKAVATVEAANAEKLAAAQSLIAAQRAQATTAATLAGAEAEFAAKAAAASSAAAGVTAAEATLTQARAKTSLTTNVYVASKALAAERDAQAAATAAREASIAADAEKAASLARLRVAQAEAAAAGGAVAAANTHLTIAAEGAAAASGALAQRASLVSAAWAGAQRAGAALLGLVGGPLGAGFLAVAAATAYFATRQSAAEKAAHDHADALRLIGSSAEALEQKLTKVGAALTNVDKLQIRQKLAQAEENMAATRGSLGTANSTFGLAGRWLEIGRTASNEIEEIGQKFAGASFNADGYAEELVKIANKHEDNKSLLTFIVDLLHTIDAYKAAETDAKKYRDALNGVASATESASLFPTRFTNKLGELGAKLSEITEKARALQALPGLSRRLEELVGSAPVVAETVNGYSDRHGTAQDQATQRYEANKEVAKLYLGRLTDAEAKEQIRLVGEQVKAERDYQKAVASGNVVQIARAEAKKKVADALVNGFPAAQKDKLLEQETALALERVSGAAGAAATDLGAATTATMRLAQAAGAGEAAQRAATYANKEAEATLKGNIALSAVRAANAQDEAAAILTIRNETVRGLALETANTNALTTAMAAGGEAVRAAQENEYKLGLIRKLGTDATVAGTAAQKALNDAMDAYRANRAANDNSALEKERLAANDNLALAQRELALMGEAEGMRSRALETLRNQQEAARKVAELGEEGARQWLAWQERIADTRALVDFQKEVKQTSKSIADDLAAKMFDKGGSILDWWRNLLKRMAIEIASTQFIMPIVQQVVGAVPQLFGIQAPASASGGQTAMGGGLTNTLTNTALSKGLGWAVDKAVPGGLTSGLDAWGYSTLGVGTASYGTPMVATNGMLTGGGATSLAAPTGVTGGLSGYFGAASAGAFGGALGAMIGTAANSKVVGGLSGAALGAGESALASAMGLGAVGGPVGIAVGAIVGGIMGMLGTQKKSVGPNGAGNLYIASSGLKSGPADGDNGMDGSAMLSVSDAAAQSINTIVAGIGAKFAKTTEGAFAHFTMFQEGNKWAFSDQAGGGRQEFTSQEAFVNALIKTSLQRLDGDGRISGVNADTRTALANTKATKAEDLANDLSFAAGFRKQLDALNASLNPVSNQIKTMTDAAKALGEQVKTSVTDWRDKAAELGLATDAELTAAARRGIEALMGLGPAVEPLTGLSAVTKQAEINFETLRPSLAALGYSAAEVADLSARYSQKMEDDYTASVRLLQRQGAASLSALVDPSAKLSLADRFSGMGLDPAASGVAALIAQLQAVETAAGTGALTFGQLQAALGKLDAAAMAGVVSGDQYTSLVGSLTTAWQTATGVLTVQRQGLAAIETAMDASWRANLDGRLSDAGLSGGAIEALRSSFQPLLDGAATGAATAAQMRTALAALDDQLRAGVVTADQHRAAVGVLTAAWSDSASAAQAAATAADGVASTWSNLLSTAVQEVSAGYQTMANDARQAASAWSGVADALDRARRDVLLDSQYSNLTPQGLRDGAKTEFDRLQGLVSTYADAVKAGNATSEQRQAALDAAGQLTDAGKKYLENQRAFSGDGTAYDQSLTDVRAAWEQARQLGLTLKSSETARADQADAQIARLEQLTGLGSAQRALLDQIKAAISTGNSGLDQLVALVRQTPGYTRYSAPADVQARWDGMSPDVQRSVAHTLGYSGAPTDAAFNDFIVAGGKQSQFETLVRGDGAGIDRTGVTWLEDFWARYRSGLSLPDDQRSALFSNLLAEKSRVLDTLPAGAFRALYERAVQLPDTDIEINVADAARRRGVAGFQMGGVVPGGVVGNGRYGIDSVAAEYAGGGKIWLAGREGVLTAAATAAIGGERAIAWINRHNALPPANSNDRVIGAFQRGGVIGGTSLAAARSEFWGVAAQPSPGATVDLAPVVVAVGGVRSAVLEIGGVIRDMAARLANVEDAIDGLAAEQRALGVKILKVATR